MKWSAFLLAVAQEKAKDNASAIDQSREQKVQVRKIVSVVKVEMDALEEKI